jgi:hypothetical protein
MESPGKGEIAQNFNTKAAEFFSQSALGLKVAEEISLHSIYQFQRADFINLRDSRDPRENKFNGIIAKD